MANENQDYSKPSEPDLTAAFILWLKARMVMGILPKNTKDFIVDGEWACNKCGACCKDIRWIYPELADETGRCRHLTDDNECAIYGDRPYHCKRSNFLGPSAMDEARACALTLRYADEREPSKDPE